MKGWSARRRRLNDRRVAIERLTEVAESITGEILVGERAAGGIVIIQAATAINWRDRIISALRILSLAPLRERRGEDAADAPEGGR